MTRLPFHQFLIFILMIPASHRVYGVPGSDSTVKRPESSEQALEVADTLDLHSPESIQAPFSVHECLNLLASCQKSLELPGVGEASSRATLGKALKSVMRCIRDMDRANPSLQFYTWHHVSKNKVPSHGAREQVIELRRPIDGTTAVSMKVKNGDVKIHSLMAYDENGTAWEFTQPMVIPANQPRPHFLFLPLPTRLSRIRIMCSRQEPTGERLPRLFLKAGVCRKPEAAKYALYYLKLARQFLESGNPENTRDPIRKASRMLQLFKETRLNE